MSFISDIIKDIFAINPQTGLVGLSGLKEISETKKTKKIKTSKSEPKLSELMKKSHKQLKV